MFFIVFDIFAKSLITGGEKLIFGNIFGEESLVIGRIKFGHVKQNPSTHFHFIFPKKNKADP